LQIDHVLKSFFEKHDLGGGVNASVIREDGITIYSTLAAGTTLGVLANSAWQASAALVKHMGHNGEEFEFRFSFETSSDGTYVLPFHFLGDDFILAIFYRDVTNPGVLKNKVRNTKEDLCKFLLESEMNLKAKFKNNILERSTEQNCGEQLQSNDRKNQLFNGLTDDEMNGLFSRLG